MDDPAVEPPSTAPSARNGHGSESDEVHILHYSDLENVYDDPDRVGRLVGLLEARRGPATILAGTGDNLAPCALSVLTEGAQARDFFEAIQPDLDTLGNHDFDYGIARTRELIEETPQTWVTSNVRCEGRCFGPSDDAVTTTVLTRDGMQVGFFGVLDPRALAFTSCAGDVTITDPYEAAGNAVETLRSRGVDYIVALSHLGERDDQLARTTEIDLILGGHDHRSRAECVDGTSIVHSGVNGSAIAEVTLGSGDCQIDHLSVADATPNSETSARYEALLAEHDLSRPVAHVAEPIARSEKEIYAGETRIGNWIADAYRWVSGADIGLQNSGGIRAGQPLSGEITRANCLNLAPFAEPVIVATLSGAELHRLFRDAVDPTSATRRWHAQVSGVRLMYDPTTKDVDLLSVDGEPVVADTEYTIATSRYLLYTEEEFPVLTHDHLTRSVEMQYDVLLEYARTHGIEAPLENRIITPASRNGSTVDREGAGWLTTDSSLISSAVENVQTFPR